MHHTAAYWLLTDAQLVPERWATTPYPFILFSMTLYGMGYPFSSVWFSHPGFLCTHSLLTGRAHGKGKGP